MNENSDIFDLKLQRNDFGALLEDRRKNKKFTDVQLQIGDKLFDAHRAVLSISSPVLETTISEHWPTTKICPISDEYVDVDIVEDLLSFLYTGSIKLTPNNVQPVCAAAHFLQIPTLLEPSVKYLSRLINIDNVLSLFVFSNSCELEHLNYACLRFVTQNHEKVLQKSEILEFPPENFKNLIVGLKKFWAKMLRVNTFHTIVRWTEKNLSERLNNFPILPENIPLEELPFEFLTETVSNHPLVKDSMSSIETVSTALANYQTYSNPELQANQNLIVIGGRHMGARYRQSMDCYDSHDGVWKLPDRLSNGSDFGASVVDRQNIIVCGGVQDRGFTPNARATRSVNMFDWSKQAWVALPEMPERFRYFSVAVHNGYFYVAGGQSLKVMRYSFETKRWEYVASMNRESLCGKLIAHKDHLYALGGEAGRNTIERYDPVQNEWTTMTNMKNWSNFATTVHQDKIYVYGSRGFEVYDPETNVLNSFPIPPVDRNTSLLSLNDKLLVVGGYFQESNMINDLIYEFDFTTEKWIEFGKINSQLINYQIVVGAFY